MKFSKGLKMNPLILPFFQESKIKRVGTTRPCVICNREVKKPIKYYVHLVNGGSHFASKNLPESEIQNDLGLHAIGPECRKKLPEDFIFSN